MGQDNTVSKHFEGLDGEVTVQKLPAMKAQLLWVRIARVVGPGMGKLLETLDQEKAVAMVEGKGGGVAGIGDALTLLVERCTVEEFDSIRHALLAGVLYQGQPLVKVADTLLMGKTSVLWKILGFSFEANYADFSEGVRAVVGKFLARKPQNSGTSPSESPSPGPAGD